MSYRQLTQEERYTIALLRRHHWPKAEIARMLGRHRSTITRELRRNAKPYDGGYRARNAQWMANGRKRRSRRKSQFTDEDWSQVEALLRDKWSPEQIAGRLGRSGDVRISHETIYRHIWRDRQRGGTLYRSLRGAKKQRRKRYRSYDSRGFLNGKRHISKRPKRVEWRKDTCHWEIDTVAGNSKSSACIVTLVERASGYTLIGKVASRKAADVGAATLELMSRHPHRFRTVTADNGTEFHNYKDIERATRARYYFATPYHSWERGTNENTNGLIRQYLPRGATMVPITQAQCDSIADELNRRPRKRLRYRTPKEFFNV